MLKFLVVGIILAVPIVCAEVVEEDLHFEKKPRVEGDEESYYVNKRRVKGISEGILHLRCKNVSGSDDDVKRNERLYEEYNGCIEEAIHFKQYGNETDIVGGYLHWNNRDYNNFIQPKLHLVEIFVQKYCPKFIKFLPCDDILAPIYTDCYSAEQRHLQTTLMKLFMHGLQFVCEGNAEEAIKVINGKFFECTYTNRTEVKDCFRRKFDDPIYLCRDFLSLADCILTIYERCELSDIPFKFLTSWLEEIKKEKICARFDNVTNFNTNPTQS